MDYQSKFLDKSFVFNRVSANADIRKGAVQFKLDASPRPNSKTLYVEFWINGYRYNTMRISDHKANTPYATFFVIPDAPMTAQKKKMFDRTVANAIEKCKRKSLLFSFKTLDKAKTP